ncbi:hypothetical protein INP83_08620 [Mucilaginibacter sp. 21P]|uniref:hypothetical protein n=1 Tax=Mucilaginibacter sp. 21P TaxID=2778902 RepID=UPI001C57E64D|nr:hypothetical protein [Mucilaginibacter sp. 21P]QXV67130.1 hypothetical protein INP83_08620 [Mucilaginibacter sp. 21P]
MRRKKEYNFKKASIWFDVVMAVFLVSVFIYCLLSIFFDGASRFVLLVLIIPAFLLWFQAYVIFITIQFNNADNGKQIIIDDLGDNMIVIQHDEQININRDEIDLVEIHEQKSLGKFGTYNYMVIVLKSAVKITITQFTVPLLAYDNIMQSFLREKPRQYYKKTFNYIRL